jgi:hypothetical protein
MLDASPTNTTIGVTLGFIIGLSMIYGVEYVVGRIESADEEKTTSETDRTSNPLIQPLVNPSSPSKTFPKGYERIDSIEEGEGDKLKLNWEDEPVEKASLAVAVPNHRSHIAQHLDELLASVKSLEVKSDALLEKHLAVSESEEISELIDKEVHSLQYKLDHCRRFIYNTFS